MVDALLPMQLLLLRPYQTLPLLINLEPLAHHRLPPTLLLLQADDVMLIRIPSALALTLEPLLASLQALLLRLEARGLPVVGLHPALMQTREAIKMLEQLRERGPGDGIEPLRSHPSRGTGLHSAACQRVRS